MGTALVTGATSGIGEEFCWQLAAAGHDLVLVARREDAMRALVDSLANVAGARAQVIAADLATDEGCARVAARLDVGGPTTATSRTWRPSTSSSTTPDSAWEPTSWTTASRTRSTA